MPRTARALPRVERLNNGRPLIEKIDHHPWENRVTFNPGCALVNDPLMLTDIVDRLPFDGPTKGLLRSQAALCFLLYRAQGRKSDLYDYTRSSVGLAVLSADLKILARYDRPVMLPDREYDDLGVEDVRISLMGQRYLMLYTAYSSAQPKNKIRIALASSTDFLHWEKHGLLRGDFNEIDNKNAMLFPERINGKFVLLHRPMEGPDAMAIHWAESDDLFGVWNSRGVLMKPIRNPAFVDTWIGGGAPPLRLVDGRYLILYHIGNRKSDMTRQYDLGIALGDADRPELIVKRDEPLLRPETPEETKGDPELGVNNVVFVCGAYFYKGDLYFPYAGADSVVLGGRILKHELERFLAR